MIWESFFDEPLLPTETFSLWKPNDPDLKIDSMEPLFKGFLLKVDKNSNSLKPRLFVVTDEYLYYTRVTLPSNAQNEKSKTIRGIMKIKFVKVSFFEEEEEGQATKLCVRFIKNMKFCDLYAQNEEEWLEWRQQLAHMMIQTDFHSKYGVVRMLGKGSFAKVYLVENKATEKRFAVKAFSKEFLESQNKGKVRSRLTVGVVDQ